MRPWTCKHCIRKTKAKSETVLFSTVRGPTQVLDDGPSHTSHEKGITQIVSSQSLNGFGGHLQSPRAESTPAISAPTPQAKIPDIVAAAKEGWGLELGSSRKSAIALNGRSSWYSPSTSVAPELGVKAKTRDPLPTGALTFNARSCPISADTHFAKLKLEGKPELPPAELALSIVPAAAIGSHRTDWQLSSFTRTRSDLRLSGQATEQKPCVRLAPSLPACGVKSTGLKKSKLGGEVLDTQMDRLDRQGHITSNIRCTGGDAESSQPSPAGRDPSSTDKGKDESHSRPFAGTGQWDLPGAITPPLIKGGITDVQRVKRCSGCKKKIFGSATSCSMCIEGRQRRPKKMTTSSPVLYETPETETEDILILGERRLSHPARSTSQKFVNQGHSGKSVKRPFASMGSTHDDGMFIHKKMRKAVPMRESGVFRPMNQQNTLRKISPPQPKILVDGPHVNGASSEGTGEFQSAATVLAELEAVRREAALVRQERDPEKTQSEELQREVADLTIRMLQSEQRRAQETARKAYSSPSSTEEKLDQNGGVRKGPTLLEMKVSLEKNLKSFTKALHLPRNLVVSNIANRTANRTWTKKAEDQLLRRMEARGVMFETGYDSEDASQRPLTESQCIERDPLRYRLKSSHNLFAIAPQFELQNTYFDKGMMMRKIASRPSRKRTFGKVINVSRRKLGAHLHQELDRGLQSREVRLHMPDRADGYDHGGDEPDHTDCHDVMPMGEVAMTFEEFLGIPDRPLFCLTDRKQLAFRSGILDARGKLPRVSDREKFEIGAR